MNEIIAFFLLRAGLGLNILLHGLVRLKNGRVLFLNALAREFEGSGLPPLTIKTAGLALPYLETGIGLLLVCGLETQGVLIAGCLLMFLLLAGKSLVSDWVTVTFQMIYILVYCILLFYLQFNRISADIFFALKP
ncbi:hypothetical protein [Mucilaginibacter gotjawali]|uniref:Thiosulfate dehydrogenase [quinone] large subunit n=2 Tax=Mucilaginibacter gotjawali TaxID=1550579 RepID=A0A839S8F7_9SPHI|nr:hypothetical protein [Mucilaginibacter gotjawali]MBB3054235.1 thiosulfate dehydrogenase [quinone] large subunit [Mucilaginibacter gotjawali]BAU51932.1 hypothetical protein MgSA37_00081 [Mucilaginibacter gotjawali]